MLLFSINVLFNTESIRMLCISRIVMIYFKYCQKNFNKKIS